MPDIFGVIADANRRDILRTLLEADKQDVEMSVSDIVEKLGVSQPTVSKHLKVLRAAELVTVREEGQHRFYSLNAEPLSLVEDFVMPFLLTKVDTEVSVEYVDADGAVVGQGDAEDEVLPAAAQAAVERIGHAAAVAENRMKELVARFRLRG